MVDLLENKVASYLVKINTLEENECELKEKLSSRSFNSSKTRPRLRVFAMTLPSRLLRMRG